MASKRKRLDGHLIMKRNNHCIIASELVAILPHEVECCRPHLVPGWCVAVHSEHHLSKINQYLQSFVPLPGELSHIKRIDSCRSYENKSTYVFLQIAKSRFVLWTLSARIKCQLVFVSHVVIHLLTTGSCGRFRALYRSASGITGLLNRSK